MTGNADWSSLELTYRGATAPDSRERFPKTWAMLDALPLCRIGRRAPAPMFSLLKGGARIPPHHGAVNCRLICHLPLVVPGNGALRVGNQTRAWEHGKLLIFDDSFEHEAWNDAASDRIVLIFDVWHPDVTEAERDGIAALFNVVDRNAA
jgi:aspartyl/asparaginyl beta-hydroxylase (cupin superfamily)